ncbi:MAG TPA: Rieske 2Fe-2S domain-containing protein [Kofleriaceae bacterium]|nr:Rieske 2Fe-2S domain-containing protein [Kofleriaceae bacterium]
MALRVRVCRLAEVAPGVLRAFRVAGVTWPVIVTIVDGELRAVPGVCPHEDVELAGGELDGATIVCPGHGYRFDLRTGQCAHDPALELRRYPITLVGDEVWIDLL